MILIAVDRCEYRSLLVSIVICFESWTPRRLSLPANQANASRIRFWQADHPLLLLRGGYITDATAIKA
jgi:hypothetical protein